jgi:hypothetical protein
MKGINPSKKYRKLKRFAIVVVGVRSGAVVQALHRRDRKEIILLTHLEMIISTACKQLSQRAMAS